MSDSVAERLGLGRREMVAFVGAGGKSTLLLRSGYAVQAAGWVVMTTTTKMSPAQIPEWARTVTAPIADATDAPVFLMGGIEEDKIVGVAPDHLDELFTRRDGPRYVLVEADGARRHSIKAPADHEPVIPAATTRVVAIAGVGVVGQRIDHAAHRPDRVAALLGKQVHGELAPEDVAAVLTHEDGGLKGVPGSASVTVAITGVDAGRQMVADRILDLVRIHPRVERAVSFGAVGMERP